MKYLWLVLAVSVASAQTYYDKTTIPPTGATNTVIGNKTSATAAPTYMAVGSCSTSGSALKWTTNTGFGCNTSIDAATLGGATFAAPGSIGSGTAAAGAFSTLSATGQITSTLATGTAPFSIASTTNVANLNASLLNGATFAAPGAIGGGTPSAGAFTTISATGQITSTLAIGTAPFAVTSTTNVANLNASSLSGATFAAPGAIGGGTPAAGTFTTLDANGIVNLNNNNNAATNINTGTSTSTVTLGQNTATPGAVAIKGPVSFQAGTAFTGASWTTTSPVFNGVAMTLNDTTASGTVVTEAAYTLQAPTFTSTGAGSTTITNPTTLWIAAPVCSGGVVCTNTTSLFTTGKVSLQSGVTVTGNTINLNASSNAAVNISTGTNNQAVHIGDGSGNNAITIGNGTGLVNFANLENAAGTTFTAGTFSGCSTTNGSPTSLTGGSQTGSFVTASSGTTCSVVLTPNGATGLTAAHGWYCAGADITSGVALVQTAKGTTTCTLKGTINATSDVVVWHGFAY